MTPRCLVSLSGVTVAAKIYVHGIR